MSEDKNKKEKSNPLRTVWNVFGTIGGVLSLSSMTQTWFDDLIKFKGFFVGVFEAYRSIVEPVSEYLFSWLPFDMWIWFGDYFVLGIIYMASLGRVIIPIISESFGVMISEKDEGHLILLLFIGLIIFVMYVVSIMFVLSIWIYFLTASVNPAFARDNYNPAEKEEAIMVLNSMGAIILCSVMLLSLNAVL